MTTAIWDLQLTLLGDYTALLDVEQPSDVAPDAPSLDLALQLHKPDLDGVSRVRIKKTLRGRADATTATDIEVTARTHLHVIAAGLDWQLEPIHRLTPAQLLIAPIHPQARPATDAICREVFLALQAQFKRFDDSSGRELDVRRSRTKTNGPQLASPAPSNRDLPRNSSSDSNVSIASTDAEAAADVPVAAPPAIPSTDINSSNTPVIEPRSRKRRWDVPAVHAAKAPKLDAPVQRQHFQLPASSVSMPAEVLSASAPVQSPIDFVCANSRLARREWTPQWWRAQLRVILALMPQLPLRLPRIDRALDEALNFSVDRTKLPTPGVLYTPTPWTSDGVVLHILRAYVYDGKQPISEDNVNWLHKNAEPGLFKLINGLVSVYEMQQTVTEGWQVLRRGLEHRRAHMDHKTRDPVLQHCELVQSLLSDPAAMLRFLMDGERFREIPGGPEITSIIGEGPYRRLSTNDGTSRSSHHL